MIQKRKLRKLIPKGIYCTSRKGKCSFFDYITDENISIPYCHFLNEGDITEISDEAFNKLEKKYGMEIWSMYSLDLLAQDCKCCGINE